MQPSDIVRQLRPPSPGFRWRERANAVGRPSLERDRRGYLAKQYDSAPCKTAIHSVFGDADASRCRRRRFGEFLKLIVRHRVVIDHPLTELARILTLTVVMSIGVEL
jgi:hypothetical protein